MKYTGLQEHIRWCIEFSWPLWHFICGCKNFCYCVCVFVWCNCNLQVVLPHLWKYFGPTIHQITGCPCHEWGERMSLSLGESRVSCQAHGHNFHSLVSLKMKISAGEIFDRWSFLQVWICIMFFFESIKATTTKTSKETKEILPKSSKVTQKLPCIASVLHGHSPQKKMKRNKFY